VQGFPGVGKTRVARDLVAGVSVPRAFVELPEGDSASFDDLLMDAAGELEATGRPEIAEAIDRGTPLVDAFEHAMREQMVLVIDEFQRAFRGADGALLGPVDKLLQRLARRPGRGRLLLLTSQRVDAAARWAEPLKVQPPLALETGEARKLLDALLAEAGRDDDISAERRDDVVRWLGNNPRAMRVLVGGLESDPLDSLIGLEREAWEVRDREVSPELLRQLERKLLARVLSHQDEPVRALLRGLSVYRKLFDRHAIDAQLAPGAASAALRRQLVDRFLLDLAHGWYSLHPIAREIGLGELKTDEPVLRAAHGKAADHYTRHFKARELLQVGALGGHFVEARYHLVNAGREGELEPIVRRFQHHLVSLYESTSPVPQSASERDERIAVLSAFLKEGGPKGLGYYLARLLEARGRPGDRQRALEAVRGACGPKAPAETWVLRIRLEAVVVGVDAAVRVFDKGVKLVPADKNLFALYQSCGELLAGSGRVDDAVELLKKGIDRIPVDKSLFALYQSCGELLAGSGRVDDAVALLKKGIKRIPSDQSAVALYQSCGELLAHTGQADDAVALLKEGIERIPADKGVNMLYQLLAAIHGRTGADEEAQAVLARGIAALPPGKVANRYKLAEAAALRAASMRSPEHLERLLCATGKSAMEPPQRAFATVLRLEMDQLWERAATTAASFRPEFPTYLHLASQEAFCWLCAGFPDRAREALASYPRAQKREAGSAWFWLKAFVALRSGDRDVAADTFAAYLGRSLNADEEPTEAALLRLWDETATTLDESNLAYFFPFLPPSLTGLAAPVTRTQHGLPVHPKPQNKPTLSGGASARLAVLAIASEWASGHGGLSTFNRELCVAWAKARPEHRVLCLVPSRPSTKESDDAREQGVELVVASDQHGLSEEARLAVRPTLPEGVSPQLILGHGRVTGPAASVLTASFPGSRRVHFIHVAPEEIEYFKDQPPGQSASQKAEERMLHDVDRAASADLAVAVGPRLTRVVGNELHARGKKVHEILPGLPQIEAAPGPPPALQCLLLGRAEDYELKGLDIAAHALASVDVSKFEWPPWLLIRGAPKGTGDELQRRLRDSAAKPALQVRVREYTADAARIVNDLRGSSVVLMPSRTEGFGLVGLEAIAAGVPVLISDQSGLGEMIAQRCRGLARHHVVPVTTDLQTDAKTWARAIEHVLWDPKAAFARARELREALRAILSWEKAVAEIVAQLGL
jgi:glycosyltransferase involved in cell wall biosynthesis/tetratricopeptide (TPR) repeat protein